MSELGWLAMECPAGSLHLNTDSFYMELLIGGEPAPMGEMGELVVTSIGARLCPHVRYRTGDMYRRVPPCPCGHLYPTVQMEGRRRDLVVGDGTAVLTPRSLDSVMNIDWIDLYRLEQRDQRHLDLRYVVNTRYRPRAELALTDQLRERIGPDFVLRLERTDYIPCDRSGKFVSCSSVPSREIAR
jgi:phenylacetate-CoA ligase